MAGKNEEKTEMTSLLVNAIANTINDYAVRHPATGLTVQDIREVLVKILDYLDISEITGYGPWKK
ncbi:MAG: hypothetical protein JXQ83_09290 [Candidatus Glassbacteria bacterium]|nr:hypothetical protein [Candidatus Glassbacteria bacterium]